MKILPFPGLLYSVLAAALCSISASSLAATTNSNQHIIIDSGTSIESSRQNKEQWNATQSLRSKVNQRVEKDFDQYDRSVDLQQKCTNSDNLNAYWESNSGRCLDRRTGRSLMAP
ncbi:DUF1283 domain-containing protein [Biostraticola tofi]|uniref:UPF0482 protein EDC52_101134 n=1 Tax=Biostraticola tofi TaxID=466109 RepID=A0A4R3Z3F1_9GAMM|nr:DUF1283 domain-containing protein [Biostraticola tofi]TCV99797.1 uncharacterized protein DUF1283 [Biostraticola tofi]